MAWHRYELWFCCLVGRNHGQPQSLRCQFVHVGRLLVVSCSPLASKRLVIHILHSWTMLYDTIYACQDKVDDVKMGVRSTALLFGSWIQPLLVLCGVVFVAMLALAGIANQQGWSYFAVSVGGTTLHLVWQFFTVDLDSPSSCWSTSHLPPFHKRNS